jgi:hypothetical protein
MNIRVRHAGWLSALLLVCCAPALFGSGSDSHTVTVTVESINELAVSGGNITLTIDAATAGSEPDPVVDATTGLTWTTNELGKKITAATSVGSPSFTLRVEAIGVSGGTSTGVVTLSTTPQDLVNGVSSTTGSCTSRYSASATAASGIGSDIHTITLTLTDS